jgi:hypothetical protein
MIKIVKAEYISNHQLHLTFSDGAHGNYDLVPLLARETELTKALKNLDTFKAFFLELGALCWKNGLELSPSAIYRELQSNGKLVHTQQAA